MINKNSNLGPRNYRAVIIAWSSFYGALSYRGILLHPIGMSQTDLNSLIAGIVASIKEQYTLADIKFVSTNVPGDETKEWSAYDVTWVLEQGSREVEVVDPDLARYLWMSSVAPVPKKTGPGSDPNGGNSNSIPDGY